MIRLAATLAALRPGRRALALPLVAALPLLSTGCGPSVQVQLGMKNVPLDITVGNRPLQEPARPGAPTPAPLAEALPAFNVPIIGAPAAATSPPRSSGFVLPPPPPDEMAACPPLDPTRPSPAAATPEVTTTATSGQWAYRQTGTVSRGGAAAVPLDPAASRTVSGAHETSQGVFVFSETGAALGFPASSATYTATNSTAGPTTPLVSPTSRFALAGLSIPVNGGTLVFQPPTALTLLSTPAAKASQYQPDPNNPATPTTTGSWKDSQTDPVTGTAVSIDASDLGHIRVNACGTPVDAWQVQATITVVGTQVTTASGTPAPASTNLTMNVTYAVATGLGGQIVQWTEKTSGTLAAAPFSLDGDATVAAPAPAGPR
jgi:hypothetical protein